MKTGAEPGRVVEKAVRLDTAYEGAIEATLYGEVADIHRSSRFGPRNRHYRFYVCRISLPGIDLTQLDNAIERSLDALGSAKRQAGHKLGVHGYWKWFTEDEIRHGAEVSATMRTVLLEIVRAADP